MKRTLKRRSFWRCFVDDSRRERGADPRRRRSRLFQPERLEARALLAADLGVEMLSAGTDDQPSIEIALFSILDDSETVEQSFLRDGGNDQWTSEEYEEYYDDYAGYSFDDFDYEAYYGYSGEEYYWDEEDGYSEELLYFAYAWDQDDLDPSIYATLWSVADDMEFYIEDEFASDDDWVPDVKYVAFSIGSVDDDSSAWETEWLDSEEVFDDDIPPEWLYRTLTVTEDDGNEEWVATAGDWEDVSDLPILYMQNFENPEDVDADGGVYPLDAMIVVNAMNDPAAPLPGRVYLDVDGNLLFAPLDALLVYNRLNASASPASVPSGAPVENRVRGLRDSLVHNRLPPHLNSERATQLLITLERGGRPELGELYTLGEGNPPSTANDRAPATDTSQVVADEVAAIDESTEEPSLTDRLPIRIPAEILASAQTIDWESLAAPLLVHRGSLGRWSAFAALPSMLDLHVIRRGALAPDWNNVWEAISNSPLFDRFADLVAEKVADRLLAASTASRIAFGEPGTEWFEDTWIDDAVSELL